MTELTPSTNDRLLDTVDRVDDAINEFYERTKRDPVAIAVPASVYKELLVVRRYFPFPSFDCELKDHTLYYRGIPSFCHRADTIQVS